MSRLAATSTSNSSVISSAPDKAGNGRVDRAKAKPDYFKDAQNFTIPDKFSYMKIKPQGRKSKRKGPVVDGEVCIPSDQFQRQLRSVTWLKSVMCRGRQKNMLTSSKRAISSAQLTILLLKCECT